MRASSSLGSEKVGSATAAAAGLLSGLLFLLSFPPFAMASLAWVALVPLLLVRHRVTAPGLLGTAYLLAGLPVASIAYNVAIFHLGAFAIIALGVPAAFALAILAADALERRVPRVPALFVFPSCAVAVEYLLRKGFHAPVTIALSQTDRPLLIQSADLFGASVVTFLLVLASAVIERLFSWLAADTAERTTRTPDLVAAAVGSALLAANLLYGWGALRAYDDLAPTLRIAAVQPAISSETYRERWFDPHAQRTIDATLGALIDEAVRRRPDLIFLSEGSDGRYSFRVSEHRRRLARLAAGTRLGLVVASPDLTPSGEELNAVFSVSPDGAVLGRYSKQILTPVGETQVTRGSDRAPLATAAGSLGAMVCFESCFPEIGRDLVRQGAEMLLVTTSDAPFRNGSMPLLHTAFSVFRAIETRRFLVQAANTGPSLVIAPTGRTSAETSFLDPAILEGAIRPLRGTSVYARIGDVLPMAVTSWLLLAAAFALRRAPTVIAAPAAARRRRMPKIAVHSSTAYPLARLVGVSALGVGLGVAAIVASITLSTRTSGRDAGVAVSLERFFASAEPTDAEAAPAVLQTRANTCGAAALTFALRFYDIETNEAEVARHLHLEEIGTSMLELTKATTSFGMEAEGVRMNMAALRLRTQPTIVHVSGDHFVVVIEADADRILLYDPARGLVRLPAHTFEQAWNGTALVLRFPPSPELDGPPQRAASDGRHLPAGGAAS